MAATAAELTTIDSQNLLNWKIQSDRPINAANVAIENAVNDQQLTRLVEREAVQSGIALGREIMMRGIDLSRAGYARAMRYVYAPSSEETAGEAVSFAKTLASDLTSKLSDATALLAAGQQESKLAQSTAPQTGTGGSFGSSPGTALHAQIAEALALVNAVRNMAPAPAPG